MSNEKTPKETVKLAVSENKDKKVAEKTETVRMVPLEDAKTSFEITATDMVAFRKWQKEEPSAKTATVTVSSASDDPVYQMWKEESRLVKGIFRCREPDGGSVNFFFRKYKWDPTQQYTMRDGEVYEVPLAVARHLNANCNYAVHSHILGADGKPTLDRNRVKSRMNFEGMEFAVA